MLSETGAPPTDTRAQIDASSPAVTALVTFFRDCVDPSMRPLAIYNHALTVEAVAFEVRDGRWCGVLVTPWCMNLVALPGAADDWSSLVPGAEIELNYPAGNYACRLSMPENGVQHLSLPLFTSVAGFTDQATARLVAGEIMRRLHQSAPAPVDPIAAELARSGLQRPLSRRALLRGRLRARADGV